MANGWAPVPGEYPDDSSVNVELVLSDDQGEISSSFASKRAWTAL